MQTKSVSKSTAQIIKFSTNRRGRPKLNRPAYDTGTPETIMKRLLGETSEALDLCLERGIISKQQHWCGIHLRWLYTLRNGVPTVKALDLTHCGGSEEKLEDPQWKEAREQEYNEAINLLTSTGYAISLMNLCIYNERPKFLNLPKTSITKNIEEITNNISRLKSGLDILVRLWKRD